MHRKVCINNDYFQGVRGGGVENRNRNILLFIFYFLMCSFFFPMGIILIL